MNFKTDHFLSKKEVGYLGHIENGTSILSGIMFC